MRCGRRDVRSTWAREASGGGRACVLLARQPPHRAARPRRAAARTAWPRPYRRHPRRSVVLSPLKSRASLSEAAAAAGRPLKKSPIDLSARAVSCSSSFSSSSSPSSPRPRSPPRPAAAAGAGAGAAPNDSRGTAAACARPTSSAGDHVGRRRRPPPGATTPAASRSTRRRLQRPDLDAVDHGDLVARRAPAAAREAAGVERLDDGALRRRGRRRVVPLERDADPHGGVRLQRA